MSCASPLGLREDLLARGANLDVLFAEPTAAELASLRESWAQRDLSPRDVAEQHRIILNDGRLLRVISHRVGGSTHVGAVVTPGEDAVIPDDGFPVAVSLIGFGPPFEARLDPNAPSSPGAPPMVTVFPPFAATR